MSEVREIPPGSHAGVWAVRLDSFQGPVDLLAHLARTGAIDITSLPVSEIARQYEDFLGLAAALDLDAVGDALVTVAALVYMKSRSLLPQGPAEEGDGAQEDLLGTCGRGPERHAWREAAAILQEREALMELTYAGPPVGVAEYAGEQGIEADLSSLLRAFQAILQRIGDDPAARITRERVTLVDRMTWLLEQLRQKRRVGFKALFEGVADRVTCILTFLALLEIIRLRLVRALQSHHDDDILVLLADNPPPASDPHDEPSRA